MYTFTYLHEICIKKGVNFSIHEGHKLNSTSEKCVEIHTHRIHVLYIYLHLP